MCVSDCQPFSSRVSSSQEVVFPEVGGKPHGVELLAGTAVHLLNVKSEAELFAYVADRVKGLVGTDFVMVSEYDCETETVVVREVRADSHALASVERMIGRSVLGLTASIPAKTQLLIQSKKLSRLSGGVCELSFYQLPLEVCRDIERDLGIQSVHFMTFHGGRDILGMISVLSHGREVANKSLIEAIMAIASSALRRLRIEYELQEAREQYRLVVQDANEGIILTGSDGRIKLANAKIASLLGSSIQELLGKPSLSFIDPAFQDEVALHFHRRSMGIKEEYDTKLRRVDGCSLWVHVSGSPVYDARGHHLGNLGMFVDITDRRRMEDELRQMVEYAPVAIFDIDFSTMRFRRVNDAMSILLGYSREELLSMGPFDLIEQEYQVQFRERVRQMMKGIRLQETVEYRVRCKDGGFRWTDLRATPLFRDGRVLGESVVAFDVTERKRNEDILRRLTEREHERRLELQTILDTVPVLVWIAHDPESKVMTGNKATLDLVRLPPSANLSMSAPKDQRPPNYRPYLNGKPIPTQDLPMQMAARTGNPVLGSEFELRFTDGRHIELYGNAAPIKDSANVVRGSVGAFLDITKRKRIEEALTESNKELKSFSYSVAHDLRAPLRGINGYSAILLEDYAARLDGQGRRYLEKIRGSTETMGMLIDDLLQLANVSQAELKFEPVNVSLMAEKIMERLREQEPNRKVHISITPNIIVKADESLMEVVLSNLLDNAWKFTSKTPYPEITLGKTIRNGEAVFFVRDNGVGFEQIHADKLFKPFERLHGAEYAGTGIGLAMAQRVIYRHHGRIWAEGEVGKGATFYFSLPKA